MSKRVIRVHASGPWAGCELVEDIDEPADDWDSLSTAEQDELLRELAEEFFWNSGFEFWGEVVEVEDDDD